MMALLQWDENHMSYNFDMRNGPVSIEWFKGGTTNISYNCLDRNIERGLGDSPCLIWEGNEPSAPSSLSFMYPLRLRTVRLNSPPACSAGFSHAEVS